ncbi:MAG TPA: tetratricopeptide repeat protein, partial [Bacteroidia bacterium]|nr:tetratricopeptide repeat protein [Bacteroidia bacterium]HNL35214.1 tetratricopeptide repeat protein [Bacteroidia bacterium]
MNLYNANSEVLDSLLLKADGYRISDTIRAGVLNSLAVELSSSDYEKGLKYADSAIVLSTAIKADKKLATAYFAKARNLSSGGDDSLAIINYQKAYLLYLKTGNFTACATSLQNMGISYYNLSDYSLAAERHSAALDIFKKVRNDRGTAAALNSLGIIAMEVADYTKAMELYFESLKLAKKIEDST